VNPSAIRPSTAADAEAIQSVAAAAWEATYRDLVPEASRREYLAKAYDLDWLRRCHQRSDLRGFLLELAGAPAGFAMLSLGDPAEDPPGAVLRSLYLLPDAQKLGQGRQLLAAVIAAARSAGSPWLWVAVHAELAAARRWYEKQGFVYDGPAETTMGQVKVKMAVYRLALHRSE
jgi:GNAT superfamily N-acetyltransferase